MDEQAKIQTILFVSRENNRVGTGQGLTDGFVENTKCGIMNETRQMINKPIFRPRMIQFHFERSVKNRTTFLKHFVQAFWKLNLVVKNQTSEMRKLGNGHI